MERSQLRTLIFSELPSDITALSLVVLGPSLLDFTWDGET